MRFAIAAAVILNLVVTVVCDGGVPIPTENVKIDLKQQVTKDHVLEELQHQINTKAKEDMTDKELQFHYFKLHDFDNNNMLDGLEIVKAIKHSHDEHGAAADEAESHSESLSSDDELVGVVDSVLEMDDLNGDGYISFYEFMSSQVKQSDSTEGDNSA